MRTLVSPAASTDLPPRLPSLKMEAVVMTADGERKGFELALESRRSLLVVSVPQTEGEGGGENMLDSRGAAVG